jgi:hypothetical protein
MRRTMRLSQSAIVFFVCIFLTNTSYCTAKDEKGNPDVLLSHARSQQIWDEATPPLKMRGEIQVASGNGDMAHGGYTYDWVSPSQWREQIHFANFDRLRIRDAKGYWQKSTLDYQPALIFYLSGLLNLKPVLKLVETQTLGKIRSQEKDGVRQECVEVKWPKAVDRILCFDVANGALLRIEYPQAEVATPGITRIEFSDFHTVAGKLIPYKIQSFKGKTLHGALNVGEVSEVKEVSATLLKVPEGAELWPQCDDMQGAVPIYRGAPNAALNPRANRMPTRIILYGVVETDGTLSHVKVIQGADVNTNTIAFERFRQWRYKPAQCGQTLVRVETSMYFDFWF